MILTPTERLKGNLEHARWRVSFRQSLLSAHRESKTASEEWFRKDAEFLQSLKEAKAALYRLEHARGPRAA